MGKERDIKARQKLKEKYSKKILIWGATVHKSTGNSKLIYNMCKAFQSAGHQVFTIGMDYNRMQIWWDNIPIMSGFKCEKCGYFDIEKIAEQITRLHPDFFICVGDPIGIQQFEMGRLNFDNIKTKALAYVTIDSEGMFCNESLIKEGKLDYLSLCDKIISTAKFTQEQLKEWMGLDSDMIYETINTNNYSPIKKEKKNLLKKKYRFKEDDFVIYYMGRNILRKRYNILLDACAKFLCETENTYLYLNIPADNWDNDVPIFPDISNPYDFVKKVLKKKYGKDLIEEKRIIFVRRGGLGSTQISEQQNSELYNISDLFVSTTAGEGFGLGPIEANSCGIPVITPDNSTGPEILGLESGRISKDQSSGFKYAKGGLLTNTPIDLWVGHGLKQRITTPEDTYKAIKYLYDNPEERLKMGLNGAKFVKDTFNFDIFKEKWLKLISTTEKKNQFKEMEIKPSKIKPKNVT